MKDKLLLFILLMSFFSCKNNSNSDKQQQIDLNSENRYAYLKEVVKSKTRLYVKVDYVDFLIGEEAIKAEWRDKAYFVDGKDTISNITNGFYISNVNPKLRTFTIGKNAKIENILSDEGLHKITPSKNPNVEQLREYISMETLLFLYISDGVIERIDERFLP